MSSTPWDSGPVAPAYCTPTSNFLWAITLLGNTCVPTTLAFLSTLCGTLSIAAWLFAQLPQVVRNYQNQSTSGLSPWFLLQWCAADTANFVGALLTGQALWQVIIGAYYCVMDVTLVTQWIWYEQLSDKKPLTRVWRRRTERWQEDDFYDESDIESVDGNETGHKSSSKRPQPMRIPSYWSDTSAFSSAPSSYASKDPSLAGSPRLLPNSPQLMARSPQMQPRDQALSGSPLRLPNSPQLNARNPNNQLNQLSLGSSPQGYPHSPRQNARSPQVQSSPFLTPSPRSVLFISMLVALISHTQASPIADPSVITVTSAKSTKQLVGTIMSWSATCLYLVSRIPQLVKNIRRRSTAGLSMTLFVAAFFGNVFYSTSMVLNPLAWHSYPPYGEHGWVRDDPSERWEWVKNAAPFFIGAFGVLACDAAVALQFWYYGEGNQVVRRKNGKEETVEQVLAVGHPYGSASGVDGDRGRLKWRQVQGYMRGWNPSIQGTARSPMRGDRPRRHTFAAKRRKTTVAKDRVDKRKALKRSAKSDDKRSLLGRYGDGNDNNGNYGSVE